MPRVQSHPSSMFQDCAKTIADNLLTYVENPSSIFVIVSETLLEACPSLGQVAFVGYPSETQVSLQAMYPFKD